MKSLWSERMSLAVGSALLACFLSQSAAAPGLDAPIGIVGPHILSASRAYAAATENAIDVTFDEPVLPSTTMTNNLRVIRSGTAGNDAVDVLVTRIMVNGRTVRLQVEGPNWNVSECYYVMANGVTNPSGRMIAANTVMGITMSPGAAPCPVPDDAPLAELRLTIQPDGESGARISWPPGYYGFTLESRETVTGGTTDWRPVPDQRNGSFVSAGPARIFRLRK